VLAMYAQVFVFRDSKLDLHNIPALLIMTILADLGRVATI